MIEAAFCISADRNISIRLISIIEKFMHQLLANTAMRYEHLYSNQMHTCHTLRNVKLGRTYDVTILPRQQEACMLDMMRGMQQGKLIPRKRRDFPELSQLYRNGHGPCLASPDDKLMTV